MTPEIFHCVGDFVGDSLALAREAARTDAKVIVQAGVHFMAETSKILSPEKTVLIPDACAPAVRWPPPSPAPMCGCCKQKYPGLPVVTYVNTSAEVKAESDICCTSGNAVKVVEDIAREFGIDTVIMIPDKYLARNVAAKTGVKVITWEGACEVHERFTAAGNPRLSRRQSRHRRAGASRMPAGSGGGSRFRRLDRGHDRLCRRASAGAGGDDHRMLDERQCRGRISRCRIRAALQSVPAHEAHHPATASCIRLQTMTIEVIVDPADRVRARAAVDRMLAVEQRNARADGADMRRASTTSIEDRRRADSGRRHRRPVHRAEAGALPSLVLAGARAGHVRLQRLGARRHRRRGGRRRQLASACRTTPWRRAPGLCDPHIVDTGGARSAGAASTIWWRIGAPFDRKARRLAGAGPRSRAFRARIVHVKGDRAGAEISAHPGGRAPLQPTSITLLEGFHAVELAMENGRVTGLFARHGIGRRCAAGAVPRAAP